MREADEGDTSLLQAELPKLCNLEAKMGEIVDANGTHERHQ